MTLNQLRQQRGLTWQRVANELSEISKANGGETIYYHRLWLMRNGKGRLPASYEMQALLEWSDDEVDSYKDGDA